MSDIFHISINEFLKDNVINEYYKGLNKIYKKNLLRMKYTFWIILVFLIASYINMYDIYGTHFFIIPIVLLLSEFIFIINYVYKIKHIIKLVTYYFLFIFFNFCLMLLNNYFSSDISNQNISYIIGSTIGEILLNFCLSLGLLILIFLNPFKKNNMLKI